MHYLVDAYNLLFRIQKKIRHLKHNRQLLIEQLNEVADQHRLNLTLVFDGADDHLPYSLRTHFDAITIVYTPESQTADEYILEEVFQSPHPEQITVVSNDRMLSNQCRLHRARIQTIEDFLAFLVKKEKKKRLHTHHDPWKTPSSDLVRLLLIFEQKLKEQEDND